MDTNILVVDDSVFARSIIKKSLEIYGFEGLNVYEANNGYEALAVLKTHEIDVVFTDLNMPDLNGEELLRMIKSKAEFSHIPVVIITSLINPAREKRLRDEKASAIIQKPITLPQIKDVLSSELHISGGN